MYLHLGQEVVIRTKDIIGVFDIDKSTISKTTRNFLKTAEDNKKVINVSFELPKSFIITSGESSNVYISQISASTLKKRSNTIELK